ncbi:MAG: hypothetical protein GQ538_07605 [Xanthomonadales bacterium]|nr:hypothetical protein [Xanthomonadales bacterium]
MKTKTIYLTTTLLLSSTTSVFGDSAALSTNDGLELRYRQSTGQSALSVIHDISTDTHANIAGRIFSLELEFEDRDGDIRVNINKAKASYTAHDMTQRLPASELAGRNFTLSKANNDRSMKRASPEDDLEIGVGQIIGADYPVGLALVDILPVLPEQAVDIGSSWETSRDTRSLEGWAWAHGVLSARHSVTAIEQLDDHTIISVTSTARAQLEKTEKGLEYSGDGTLERTSDWRFDVTAGRLLSMSMEQNTSGINSLPQGEVKVLQTTKVEYSTSD